MLYICFLKHDIKINVEETKKKYLYIENKRGAEKGRRHTSFERAFQKLTNNQSEMCIPRLFLQYVSLPSPVDSSSREEKKKEN